MIVKFLGEKGERKKMDVQFVVQEFEFPTLFHIQKE